MFKTARLKLTAWYLLIIMIISLSFSGLIFRLIDLEINRFASSQRNRFERRLDLPPNVPRVVFIDDDLIAESRRRLLINLLMINGIILVVSGSLSYFLAGITLSPIQKMTEDQNRFITDASHELRTPLTALKSLFEVSLRDPKLDLSESKKVIATGILQANKLKNLSDSLLELSHFDTHQFQTNFGPVSLKQVVSESITQLKPKANAKKIKIINQIHLSKINGDFNKLVEVFVIFIDNAIKYSSANSQIKLTSKIKNKQIIIKIIDQGIGIDQKDLLHIFDRFYQADNARTKTNNNGYGLGLSIAKNIITLHHGKVEVNSKLNNGTTFIIYLPLFS
jgi:signal transduction histidine kinase